MVENFSFFEVSTGDILVPEDYSHDSYLSEFRKQYASRHGFYMAPEVNSKNYPRASQRLVPGMRLKVSVIGIKADRPIPISHCINYLVKSGAVLTNAHGLALAYKTNKQLFERGYAYYGLDVKEMLPEDNVAYNGKTVRSGHRHPMISVPNGTVPMPTSFSHSLSSKFGAVSRFLKFTLVS